ncbi:MAG: hypothetical protein AAGE65_08225 [Planctomycetota bacterium]
MPAPPAYPEAEPQADTEPSPAPPRTLLRHDHAPAADLLGPRSAQTELLPHFEGAGYTPTPETAGAPLPAESYLAFHERTPSPVFARAAASLRRQLPPSPDGRPRDVLHPVARATWMDLPDTGRFAVTGFSGHGNMLMHALLAALDEHALGPDKFRPRPERVERLRFDADHHGHVLRHAVEQLARRVADARGTTLISYSISGSNRVDAAAARLGFEDRHTLLIEGLPYSGFVGRDYGAHIPWDQDTVGFFRQHGFRRVYCVVREPLAGIASNAAKTLRPCEPILHHPAWLEQCARTTAGFLEQVHAHRERFRLVRFEDLLQRPIESLRRFAKDAGRRLSTQDAQAIWDRVGFKPLTPAGREHLVDPLADKHRLFRRSLYPQLQATGVFDWFKPFGYTPPGPDQLPDQPTVPLTEQLIRTTPSLLYGRPDPTQLFLLRVPHRRLDFRATDEALARLGAELAEDPDFLAAARTLGDGLLRHRTAHAV